MGAVSSAIAQAALDAGAEIVTNAAVQRILFDDAGTGAGAAKVTGVLMQDGTTLEADTVRVPPKKATNKTDASLTVQCPAMVDP